MVQHIYQHNVFLNVCGAFFFVWCKNKIFCVSNFAIDKIMGVSCLCGSFVKIVLATKATTEHIHDMFLLFLFLCHPLVIQMIDKCEKTSYIIGSTQSNRFIANQLNKLFIHSAHLESICFSASCFNIANHGWASIWSSDKQTLVLPHLIFKTKRLFLSSHFASLCRFSSSSSLLIKDLCHFNKSSLSHM